MPQTSVYGWEIEAPGEQPGRTLTGGQSGTSPVLAEQIEDDVNRIETTLIGDLKSRVTALEAIAAATRWRHISQGTHSGGNFTIPVPAGYEMLHLHLWGDLDADGAVQLRINGDTAAGLHRQGYVVQDSVTPPNDDDSDFIEDTAWFLANWGAVEGNTVDVTVFETSAGNRVAYQAYGGRQSPNATSHRRTHSAGRLEGDRVVSSLEVIANQQFAVVKWWLDGRISS